MQPVAHIKTVQLAKAKAGFYRLLSAFAIVFLWAQMRPILLKQEATEHSEGGSYAIGTF
jgi:hypothetical protein